MPDLAANFYTDEVSNGEDVQADPRTQILWDLPGFRPDRSGRRDRRLKGNSSSSHTSL